MRSPAVVLMLTAVLAAGCGSSPSTDSSAGDNRLTQQDLASDWREGVNSKGRWFARFANPMQIAFSCDVSDAEARRYHREFRETFTESLLADFEAACERGAQDQKFYEPRRDS